MPESEEQVAAIESGLRVFVVKTICKVQGSREHIPPRAHFLNDNEVREYLGSPATCPGSFALVCDFVVARDQDRAAKTYETSHSVKRDNVVKVFDVSELDDPFSEFMQSLAMPRTKFAWEGKQPLLENELESQMKKIYVWRPNSTSHYYRNSVGFWLEGLGYFDGQRKPLAWIKRHAKERVNDWYETDTKIFQYPSEAQVALKKQPRPS